MMAVHTMEERENTKASLKAWWSAFTKVKLPSKDKKSPVESLENRVFGVPLRKSLKYASVAISMAGEDGNQYVWGYVPVIVAKVGLYLKENGEWGGKKLAQARHTANSNISHISSAHNQRSKPKACSE